MHMNVVEINESNECLGHDKEGEDTGDDEGGEYEVWKNVSNGDAKGEVHSGIDDFLVTSL